MPTVRRTLISRLATRVQAASTVETQIAILRIETLSLSESMRPDNRTLSPPNGYPCKLLVSCPGATSLVSMQYREPCAASTREYNAKHELACASKDRHYRWQVHPRALSQRLMGARTYPPKPRLRDSAHEQDHDDFASAHLSAAIIIFLSWGREGVRGNRSFPRGITPVRQATCQKYTSGTAASAYNKRGFLLPLQSRR